jgi:hypothetical protein
MLEICQSACRYLKGVQLTASTRRSVIGWRVERDIGILGQTNAIKVVHSSELIPARVDLKSIR